MKKRNHVRIEVALIFLLVLGICGLAQAAWKVCPNFHTVPIPNYVNAAGRPGLYRIGYPEVYGWNVVWTAIVPHPIFPAQRQIFLFDGANTTQVSNNPYQFGAYGPFISSSNNVVYIGDDAGVDFDVFRYNIGTGVTTQLTFTATTYFKWVSDFCDPYVVVGCSDQWPGAPPPNPTFSLVEFYDGTKTINLQPRTFNYGAQIAASGIVWYAYNSGSTSDIFYYNFLNKNISQLTTSSSWSYYDPQGSLNYFAWWGIDVSGTKIFFFTGTPNTIASSNLQQWPVLGMSGPHVVWAWTDDVTGMPSVYHYDYSLPIPGYTRIYPDLAPFPWGWPMWLDLTGSYAAFAVWLGGSDHEICLYDLVNRGPIMKIAKVTSNGPVWVRVSPTLYSPAAPASWTVVWDSIPVGGSSAEAFMATRPVCDPIPKADFTNDCTVDFQDISIMASCWGQTWSPGVPPDIDGNGTIGLGDLAILLSEWLNCNIQPPIYCGKGITF
jgi:hypothetical protein